MFCFSKKKKIMNSILKMCVPSTLHAIDLNKISLSYTQKKQTFRIQVYNLLRIENLWKYKSWDLLFIW